MYCFLTIVNVIINTLIRQTNERRNNMQEITLETIFNTLLQFKEETNNRFNKIDKHLEKVDRHLEEVDRHLEEVDKHLEEVDKHLNQIDGRFEEVDGHFKKSDSRLDSLERIVTKIEFEHGEKLAFLCDNAKINNEKHEEFEKELKSIQTQLMDHELRIQVLEENFRESFISQK